MLTVATSSLMACALQAAMHQVGPDTVIAIDADHSITLQNVTAPSLHASDVLFV